MRSFGGPLEPFNDRTRRRVRAAAALRPQILREAKKADRIERGQARDVRDRADRATVESPLLAEAATGELDLFPSLLLSPGNSQT
jgi:hypothetical protein